MVWPRRILNKLAATLLLGFIGFNLFKKQIASALFQRGAEARVGADQCAELPDGLQVYLCGVGSPMPDTTRAGPCLGVLPGDRAFIFDVGAGGVRNFGSMGFPTAKLESRCLTHRHVLARLSTANRRPLRLKALQASFKIDAHVRLRLRPLYG